MPKLNLRALITVFFAAVFLLSACAKANKSDQPAPTQQATTIPKPPQPLLIWHPFSGTESAALDQIRLNFQTAHPMIDVQLQFVDEGTLLNDFKTALNQGGGPDLLIGPAAWLLPLANQGFLKPFSLDFLDDISSNLTKPVTRSTLINGTPYAAAFSTELATLYYNRTLVKTPPTRYSELIDQAALYKLLIPPTFEATSGRYLSNNNLLMDEQGHSLITPPALETYLTDLDTLARSPGVTFTHDQTDFIERRAGLLLASSSDYRTLQAALGSDLGVIRLPVFEPNPWRTLITVQPIMLGINSTAEATQSARQFIVFLTKSSTQRDWFEQTGRTPVNPAELAEDDLRAAWADALEWGTTAPLSPAYYDTLRPALDQAVQAVVVEGKDPVATAAATITALQSLAP